ncbi:MBL fold metallo-hydrolase [Natranaerovirga hydrolytica]|nr:MBL fold metallo-hydrolase [Natranaerovirga hydrolytica]
MYLSSIASGSSGNCIYVGSEQTNLIIDAGVSGKKIECGLNSIGLKTAEMDGIFVTHEHSDHIKGIGVVARRYGIPIYATQETAQAILNTQSVGKIPEGLIHIINSNEDLHIKDLTIHPYNIPHDAVDPVCYTIMNDQKKVSIATDLGNYNDYIIEKLSDSNILFIEANHDINMLQVGAYPYFLKQRILGEEGHLSNESCGQLIAKLSHSALEHIVLGHLSNENNFEELAFKTVQMEINALCDYNADELNMFVASRKEHSKRIAI